MLNNVLLTETGTLWLGSESSYHATLLAYQKMGEANEQTYKKECFAKDEDDDENDRHFLLDVVDSVGLITVRGSLVSGSEGVWGQYWGVVGYDDIRNAIVTAINSGVESILIDYDTPGGAVKGIMELADFIKSLQIPTTSFTGGMAASGGLWLATASDTFYAARMAEIGSVGVLAVTAEMTEMYKEMGINIKVFKSTPLKAGGNPYEKRTAEVEAEIQKNIDETHMFFVREIAENQGLTEEYVSENIANGKVWYAAEAHELRLIDGIKTFDEILLVLTRETADNTDNFQHVQDNEMANQRKKILTEQEAAAIASGANVETVLEDVKPDTKAEGEDTSKDDDATSTKAEGNEDPDNTKADDKADAKSDTAGEEGTEASATSTEKEVTALDVLQTQVSSLQDGIVDLKVELKQAQAKAAALEATHEGLKKVTAAATQRHFVAIGSRPPELEGLLALDASALLAQHASAYALVAKQYPAGGQVSVTVDDTEDPSVAAAAQVISDNLLKQARINNHD